VISLPSEDLKPSDITWMVSSGARSEISSLPAVVQQGYDAMVSALRDQICAYINARQQCDAKGYGIAPKGGADGGKLLKVRQAIPGGGKSGGLRVLMVAYCDRRLVKVTGATLRRDA